MQKTYLFYDIETTGLNKCFDQVLQFAAIRTDFKLNEIERIEIQVKLNPDVIPAPEAIITHYIGVAQCQKGESEYEATKKIHQLLNEPGTISVGYNTLGFDDEFLRFSFHRNLLPPYTHQFANQCGRMDIYPITAMYYLYQNDALRWPMIDGKVSLKLENLSKENKLADGQAHDAMVDVEATLALAKKLAKHEKMWKYVTEYFNKKTDIARMNDLNGRGLIVSGSLGFKNNFEAPVMLLGQHQHYKNQSLWLRLDTEALQTTTPESIADTTWVFRRRAGENLLLLPMKERFLEKLSAERKALMQENISWLENNPDLLKEITEYYKHFKYPVVENVDLDANLYNLPFATQQEEGLFREFHLAPLEKKLNAADLFPNPKRREQAIRIIGRLSTAAFDEKNAKAFQDYLKHATQNNSPLIDFRGEKKLTKEQALTSTQALLQSNDLNTQQKKLLDELETYLI